MKGRSVVLATSIVWMTYSTNILADQTDWQIRRQRESNSYAQGFTPNLGGVYRTPDAYLPYYPGYAPYWQTAPQYPYAIPMFFYPYQYYPPVYMPANRLFGSGAYPSKSAYPKGK